MQNHIQRQKKIVGNYFSLFKIPFNVSKNEFLPLELINKGVLKAKPLKNDSNDPNIINYYFTYCSITNVINHLYCHEKDDMIKSRINYCIQQIKLYNRIESKNNKNIEHLFDYYFEKSKTQLTENETVESIIKNLIRPTKSGKQILLYKRNKNNIIKSNKEKKIDPVNIRTFRTVQGAATIKIVSLKNQIDKLKNKFNNNNVKNQSNNINSNSRNTNKT